MSNYTEGLSVSKLVDGLRCESAEIGIINGSSDVFNVDGLVYLHSIVGRVATTIGGASTMRLRHNSAFAAAANLSADHADIDAHAPGIFYAITGTAANATVSSNQLLAKQAAGFVLNSGVIEMTTSADRTGGIIWTVFYTPITDGASISAA
jgi:hypothetical protein